MKNKCLLCQLENDNEQAIVFESNYCYFLMKKQTVLIGSGIIIPKAHKENVFELSKEEWEDTYILLKKVKNYLDEHYQQMDIMLVGTVVRLLVNQFPMHIYILFLDIKKRNTQVKEYDIG